MTIRSLNLPLLLVSLAAGCASMSLRDRPWPELHVDTKELAQRFPHAPAAILERSIHYRFTNEADARWIREEYVALAILDDGGEQYAVVRVPVGIGRVSFLRARTRLPDGTTQDLTPEEQHDVVGRPASALSEAQDEKVKVFRLPRVHVGSIVEYSYGIEYPTVPLAQSEPISSEIPVQHYHLEFLSEGGFAGRAYLYNRNAEFRQDRVDNSDRVFVDVADIPAYHPEKFAPPITVTEPWWALAVSQTGWRGRVPLDMDSWDKIGGLLGQALYVNGERLLEGVNLGQKLEAVCPRNSRCAVQAALDLVNRMSDLSTFVDELIWRPMKQTLAENKVTSFDKALLLRGALAAVGVQSRYALLSRVPIHEADPKFASLRRGDHLLLYLDSLDGSEPLYVDPSCESCEVGTLPSWSAGRQTQIIMHATTSDFRHSDPTGAIRWGMTPDTRDQTPSVVRQIIDAKIDLDGKLSGHYERELRNEAAVDQHIVTRNFIDAQWQKHGDEELQSHFKTARRESSVTTQWDKHSALWKGAFDFSAAGYATLDRDQLIVPLTFLHDGYDEDYSDEPRVHDVMERATKQYEDTLTLHVPSGYVVSQLPKGDALHIRSADGVFEVSAPKPDIIRVHRVLRLHAGHWGPDEYVRLVTLIRELEAGRQAAIVLKKAG